MPRYFFNVKDGHDIKDEEGTVFSDDAKAREQAIITAAEILRSEGKTLPPHELWEMVVEDETGRRTLTLRFSAEDYPEPV
jgi:hypothetical protein